LMLERGVVFLLQDDDGAWGEPGVSSG